MARSKNFSRFSVAVMAVASCAAVALPSTAQAGFFEQLFGVQPSPQPSYEYERPAQPEGNVEPLIIQRHAAKKVAVDDKPVLQKTTDLMHDKTLRPGDAVMTKTGIHVYAGREKSVHNSGEFVALDDAHHIKGEAKVMLAALDATRNDPLTKPTTPDTLASGRSAAVSSPIVAGVKFTDQTGRTIRYVGP